jgi:S1-C subfamily serine protease/pSer/pThr/pTyr-binding forkhead associated (FHA) protein
MSIELRITGGARNGHRQTFEKSVISIGRHPMSDLHFDTKKDLDVSTRHGEIRSVDGRYTIFDHQSTNGTFVNGERVPPTGSRELRGGDVITFGMGGPTVEVQLHGSRPVGVAGARVSSAAETRPSASVPAPGRPVAASVPAPGAPVTAHRPTTERIAIAVHEQTRGLRMTVGAAVVLLGGLAVGLYWMGHREAVVRDAEIAQLLAKNDSASRAFQDRLRGMNDTTLTNSLRRRNDSLTKVVRDARGSKASADAQRRLQQDNDIQQKFSRMNFTAVRDANDPAIVLIVSNLEQGLEATGFSVSASGLIVTNRHVVVDSTGRATRINVKFANTGRWLPAHLVKTADSDQIDLALVQVDEAGTYPKVHSIAPSVDAPVGSAIASLGFPDGTDAPMDGSSAKTALTLGTVSKVVPETLQIDSYATHGSSGSPVFDDHGRVIGVIWGGLTESRGRIVYAVPADRLTALLKGTK